MSHSNTKEEQGKKHKAENVESNRLLQKIEAKCPRNAPVSLCPCEGSSLGFLTGTAAVKMKFPVHQFLW